MTPEINADLDELIDTRKKLTELITLSKAFGNKVDISGSVYTKSQLEQFLADINMKITILEQEKPGLSYIKGISE